MNAFDSLDHENFSLAAPDEDGLALDPGYAIDPAAFRDALGCFATGVTVMTTRSEDGEPTGLTVNSFNSVSLDPPLVIWSLKLNAKCLPAFRSRRAFAVNILSSGQKDICLSFATSNSDKFAGVEWTPGLFGVPLIHGAFVQLVCSTVSRFPGGDHEIYLGRVLQINKFDKGPLVYYRGGFVDFVSAVN